ncbi:MAG: YbgA family protein [Planctomycetota bacterium]|jgi:uncharacterized protein YbgA (DUF1722 family)/uncharacterized protein YbbK (DUF523 family)
MSQSGVPRLRVGASTCLLGEDVRYDGTNKRSRWLTDVLGVHADWVPVCPEVEFGLGIPRPTIRLEDAGKGRARLVQPKTGRDLTAAMDRWSVKRARALDSEDLDGYVLKARSPSCGMWRVKVYGEPGKSPRNDGRGVFAAALAERFPLLPIEEEGRLNDPKLRETFIEQLFAYRRLKELFSGRWTVGQLVAFHTAHKLQLMAHDPAGYKELGPLVARAKRLKRADLRERYGVRFMEAMATPASRGRHVNALQHMAGYFRTDLDEASRDELRGVIDDYRRELVPLVVPMTLIRHHVRRLGVAYLAGQLYLQPHPRELMLRNHV